VHRARMVVRFGAQMEVEMEVEVAVWRQACNYEGQSHERWSINLNCVCVCATMIESKRKRRVQMDKVSVCVCVWEHLDWNWDDLLSSD